MTFPVYIYACVCMGLSQATNYWVDYRINPLSMVYIYICTSGICAPIFCVVLLDPVLARKQSWSCHLSPMLQAHHSSSPALEGSSVRYLCLPLRVVHIYMYLLSTLRDTQPVDLLSSNHLLETDRLYSEVCSIAYSAFAV